jgi:hypothetical protein
MDQEYPNVVGTDELMINTVSGVTTSNPTNDDKIESAAKALVSCWKNKKVKKTDDMSMLLPDEIPRVSAVITQNIQYLQEGNREKLNWELMCLSKATYVRR